VTISDWIPVVLFVLGFIQLILVGILGWALLKIVTMSEKVVKLNAEVVALQSEVNSHRSDAEKKFDELKDYIGKLFEKMDTLNALVGEVLLHRRRQDSKENGS
jgi:hypothetical protein